MTGDDLGFAVVDSSRSKRTGYPEVVYCAGKTNDQALAIVERMRDQSIPVLATKVSAELAALVATRFPEAHYDAPSGILTIDRVAPPTGLVAVVTGGTSDLPVAREAMLTAQFLGSEVRLFTDVGVAGLHRLLERLPDIRQARVIVAVAGMEGALPSVVAGLVDVPVIAVPTSVGYGANFGGLSALLGMLTACAPGISTVNIDNGFGAGYQAHLINKPRG